jgi:hypothetical protein
MIKVLVNLVQVAAITHLILAQKASSMDSLLAIILKT